MVTKIVYFDYAAIIAILVVIGSCFVRKATKGPSNKSFLAFSFVILMTAVFSSLAINIDNKGPGNLGLKYFYHTGYLILHSYSAVQYLIYLIVITDTWHVVKKKKYYVFFLFVPIFIATLLIFINLFYPIMFDFGSYDIYTRKPLFYILYVIGFYYLTLGVVFIIKNKRMFPAKMRVTVFSLYPITLLTTIFEMIIPNVVVELFGNAISMIIIYMNMQRKEDLIDPDTKFFNAHTFAFELGNVFFNEKNVAVIIVNIVNYRSLRDIIGYERPFKLSKTIALGIERICKVFDLNLRTFYMKNGQFRLVIDEKDFGKVEKVAQALNEYLKTPLKTDNLEINLLSCVCIAYCPSEIQSFDGLMSFGKDLNNAKHYTGKVLYAKDLYNQDFYDKVLDMSSIIEHALATNGFEMYYQPIYSVKEDRITSAEALLRLKDETYGFISPEIFIPAAEKSGAIHKIGQFVLEDVARFVTSPEFKNLGIQYVEVNLSVAQCMQDNLSLTVMEVFDRYGVNTDQINLEITETALALSQDIFVKNLNNLVQAGLKISLDDFGSGYSNLQRIAQIPFEIIKIDKSFTDNCMNPKVKIILENIINMANSLNLKIVVEGIETKDILDEFIRLKCDYIQGYYFSKPIPESEFVKFVSNFSGVRA